MRKVYYIYNQKNNSYQRIYLTPLQRVVVWLKRILWLCAIFGLTYFLIMTFFSVPTDRKLEEENVLLRSQVRLLSKRMDESLKIMADVQQRDDNLYRVLLMADPIKDEVRKATYLGTNRYQKLMELSNADIIVNTTRKMDLIERQLYIQSNSFDELVELCKTQDERLKCIPAIQPVSNKDLKRTASGYGYRKDPVYNTIRFHKGMDFAASPGTPVYATGNGRVILARWKTGYGNCIMVDHGFGYKTRYAHLKKILVRRGQRVVRGQTIGQVGSTGKSTGPHLHYEVMVKDHVVNPINYYFMDLDAESYDEMIKLAANHGKVFD
jgi:murein DD-endopeptidase MepM/ murein hydrolase activator NlpD